MANTENIKHVLDTIKKLGKKCPNACGEMLKALSFQEPGEYSEEENDKRFIRKDAKALSEENHKRLVNQFFVKSDAEKKEKVFASSEAYTYDDCGLTIEVLYSKVTEGMLFFNVRMGEENISCFMNYGNYWVNGDDNPY